MKLSESSFSMFFLDEDKNILKSLWSDFTSNLDEELFKKELKQEIAWIKKYQPYSYLVDTRFFNFTIQAELQTWINENILPQYVQNGLKRIAFLQSQHHTAWVSLKQAIGQEAHQWAFETKYFEDEKAATTWLNETEYNLNH